MGNEKEIEMKKATLLVVVVVMVMMCSLSFAENSNFGESREYIVKKGDKPLDVIVSLSITAKTTPDQIIKWNPDLALHNIQIGQKIKYYVKEEKKYDLKHYIVVGSITTLFFICLSIVLFFMAKIPFLNKRSYQKTSFPITIDGKKYIYTPQRAGIYFLSLFNGGKYKSPQDAFKSSRKILQTRPDVAEKEMSAGRLKPIT